jgi:hypothetical protein
VGLSRGIAAVNQRLLAAAGSDTGGNLHRSRNARLGVFVQVRRSVLSEAHANDSQTTPPQHPPRLPKPTKRAIWFACRSIPEKSSSNGVLGTTGQAGWSVSVLCWRCCRLAVQLADSQC